MSKWYLVTYRGVGMYSPNQVVTNKDPVTWQGSTANANMYLSHLELTPEEARFFVQQYGRALDGVLENDQSSEPTKNAVERAKEMMYIKASELPPLALEFRNYLASQVGMCVEVCITAFAVYAQCVEGLPCDDDLYTVRPDHAEWFRTRVQSTGHK